MELQKLYVTLALQADQYRQGLEDAGKQAEGLRSRIGGAMAAAGQVATGALLGIGAAAVGVGAASVGVARDFESSMAIMSTAVSPASLGVESAAEAMDILGDASLRVGSDTALVGVSASTSAEAITGLYKAGLSTGEIFGDLQGYMAGTSELSGALRASVDLAAASELDMVQASELAAVTLATFGGELETAEERAAFVNDAMNNFVQTADGSVASVADLQAAFVNVGPTAAAMGMGVEDVNTALGMLSTRGITGSEAGTALKSMLTNLQRTTPDVTETLDALGVSLYDAEGVMYSLPEIIGDLETSMAGMTDEQRQQTITTLAGTYGMNAMNTLLGEGAAGWAGMEESIANAATMQETAAARTDTLAGSQEALSGVWEAFQIKVGTALIPVLTLLAAVGSSLLETYGPVLTAAFEAVAGVLSSLFANIEEGMSPLDAFIEAIWDMAPQSVLDALVSFRDDILPGLSTAFNNLVAPVIEAVTQFVSWKDVLVALGVVIGVALAPVIAGIVGAVAAVAAPILAVIAVVALLRNAWENDWGGIQGKVQAVIGFVVPLVQNGIAMIQGWWETNGAAILAKAREIFEGIQTTVQTVWGIVQTVIQTAIDIIGPALGTLMDNVKSALGGLSGLAEPLQGLWGKVGPFVQSAATVIGGILTGLLGLIVGIVKGVSEAIGPFIETFINLAENMVRIVGGILETLTGVFNLIIGLVTGNSELIEEAWEQLASGVTDIVGGLVDGVVDLISGLWDTLKTLVGGLVDGVIEFFAELYDRMVGHSIVVDLVEDVRAWFETMLVWIGEVLVNLWTVVSDPFFTMWEELKLWFLAKADEIKGIGSALIGGLTAGIDAGLDALRGILQSVADAIPQWLKEFLGIASPAKATIPVGQAIVEGLIVGVALTGEELEEALERWIVDPTLQMLDQWHGLLAAGDAAEGLAGGFAGHFERLVMRPMEEQMDSLTEKVAAAGVVYGQSFEGMAVADFVDDGSMKTLDQLLRVRSRLASQINDFKARGVDPAAWAFQLQGLDTVDQAIDAFRLRNDINAEYIRQQEKLFALEKARADLDFLKQQMELLGLMKANNIPLSALEGVTLGLGADPGQLMGIMVGVMEAVVRQTEYELNNAFNQSPAVSSATPGTTGETKTMNIQTQNINGGQHIYVTDPAESWLEQVEVLAR